MDEYISREDYCEENCGKENREGYKECTNCGMLNVPTADVQPVNQWISVKDRLPEIGKSVLIYYPKWDGDEIQVAKLEDDGMMFDICGEFNIGTGVITHWMPLPEPPKDGDSNG